MDLTLVCKNVTTPLQAANSGFPTIRRMIADGEDEKNVLKMIIVQLSNLQNILNIKNKLNQEQMYICASDILDDFKDLNFVDINLIFKRARKGFFGELYESISIDKVYQWFVRYFNERCDMAEEESIRESNEYKHTNFKNKTNSW